LSLCAAGVKAVCSSFWARRLLGIELLKSSHVQYLREYFGKLVDWFISLPRQCFAAGADRKPIVVKRRQSSVK
jgi:hypothetical protein